MSERVAAADALYDAQQWAAALALYRAAAADDPALALEAGLPMAIGHCLIELTDDDPPELPAVYGQPVAPVARAKRIEALRLRAVALARRRDFVRASRLLRFLCGYDWLVAKAYAEGMIPGRTACCELSDAPVTEDPPPFVAALRTTDAEMVRLKAWAQGKRLLVATRRFFIDNPVRQYDFHDNLVRTARAVGFTVTSFDSHILRDRPQELFAMALQEAIIACRPDVIYFDELFHSGPSAQPELAAQVELVLASAREVFGSRVINGFPDAWRLTEDALYRGLGVSVDMVHHTYAAIRERADPGHRAATVLYPYPYQLPQPSTPAGEIPRAAFAGSIHNGSVPRLFWWAELGRLDLPFDFLETDHTSAVQRSDDDFVAALRRPQVSVGLTRRESGETILCGRTIEIPLVGGCLLEEDSIDARYFMTPGVHYQPFRTVADLAELIPRLLRNPSRRRRMAEAGHAWVTRYFTGDWFWAEVLACLKVA